MDGLGRQRIVELAGHGAGLGDLLGLQTLALQHVVEVHVAAEVELVGPLELHAALAVQVGQHAMQDRRADLAFDVVADDRQPAVGEALGPVRLRGDEDRDAVDECAAGFQDLLDVPLGRHLRADRQVVHDHIGAGVLEDFHDVGGRSPRLPDPGADVPAQAIVGHAAVDAHLQVRHVGELDRVVGRREYRFGQVQTDLALDHVESGRELDGVDRVTAQVDVHQTGHDPIFGGGAVELDPLHQRRGAVADADDCNPDLLASVFTVVIHRAASRFLQVGVSPIPVAPCHASAALAAEIALARAAGTHTETCEPRYLSCFAPCRATR